MILLWLCQIMVNSWKIFKDLERLLLKWLIYIDNHRHHSCTISFQIFQAFHGDSLCEKSGMRCRERHGFFRPPWTQCLRPCSPRQGDSNWLRWIGVESEWNVCSNVSNEAINGAVSTVSNHHAAMLLGASQRWCCSSVVAHTKYINTILMILWLGTGQSVADFYN